MLIRLLIIICLIFTNISLHAKPVTTVITSEQQAAKTPEFVLQRLKEGNKRFISGNTRIQNFLKQAGKSAPSQHPMAAILSCIDSRTPPEIMFDLSIGDAFVTRTAGNVISPDILGGLEFATKLSGAKLIVVIGHTSCGAIRGACQNVKMGNLTRLLAKIQPAVNRASVDSKKDCNDSNFINHITMTNVKMVIDQIKAQSPIIAKLIKDGQVQVVGAMQDLATGKIDFIEEAVN